MKKLHPTTTNKRQSPPISAVHHPPPLSPSSHNPNRHTLSPSPRQRSHRLPHLLLRKLLRKPQLRPTRPRPPPAVPLLLFPVLHELLGPVGHVTQPPAPT
ncbi:hypothetical protein Acr_13g0005080 [Actinidia rufa]|uniref:Uncharacterized protein n=1 Tax=Actinidia rufa TaxID=165716 RepID=A0A7J0FME5_9ERIC|nr:hypothetical protein Acr_13g0005080 [Actinidia rufa]